MKNTGATRCMVCGGRTKATKQDYKFTESGLSNVVLKNVKVVKCECGESPLIPNINDLMRAIAVALILKPFELAGEDVRFLRKYLGMGTGAFAEILSVDKSTVSRWEHEEQSIGAQSDRLIRVVTLALGDGLKEKLDQAIRQFPEIRKPKKRVQTGIDQETKKVEYKEAA